MDELSALKTLGSKRIRLTEQAERLRPELEAAIRAAAAAGVPQKQIIEVTGMARESVRLASMSEEEREAERAKRRKERTK
jgi:predicted mannosyl-3-phosphoglycerate phosphatase (HAD superfamily)